MGSVATGPNGNTLFIPYAGSRGADEIHERDYRASLYSGDMGTPSWEYGYKDLDILNDGRFQMDGCRNWVGQSIRPVYIECLDPQETPTPVEAIRETASGEPVVLYKMNGLRVKSAEKGIYIRNGKKILVK